MKAEKTVVRYLTLVFLCVLAAVTIIGFPVFLTMELDGQTQGFLLQLSKKNGESVGFKLKEHTVFLENLVLDIDPDLLDNPMEAIEGVESFNVHIAYTRYGIIMPDGYAYTSDGKTERLRNTTLTKRCLEEKELIISRLDAESSIDREDSFIIMEPLIDEGEAKAVVFIVFSEEDVLKNFNSTAFSNTEIFFIIDGEGNSVVTTSSSDKLQNIENVFTSSLLGDTYQSKTVEEIKADIKDGASGVVYLGIGAKYYLYYSPLGFNDWYILSVVPSDVINSTRNTVLVYVILMCFFLVCVFILFGIYIVLSEKHKKEDLHKFLYTDSITGGCSYTKFCIDIAKALSRGKRKYAYVAMDIDSFSLINSHFGYKHGNRIIKHLDELLKSETGDGEYSARFYGDTFVALLQYSDEAQLKERVEKFCESCRSVQKYGMTDYILTPSAGIYCIEPHEKNIQKIHNCAMMAKSLVKGDGDRLCAVYNEKLQQSITGKKILADELTKAIKDGSLTVFYQPQYSAGTPKLRGAEALIRWQKSDGTNIPPSQFIPLAEERNLIKDIDRLVFEKVCKAQKAAADEGLPDIDFSVNVSQQSLYAADFVDKYIEIIEKTGADISHIHLEITESSLFDNTRMFIKLLRRLHKANFKIMMDDFGTGYSSLMLLKSLPFDYLKLDKSFIDDYANPRGSAIIECVIMMAKKLGVTLVAEGIETEAQYDYISEMGCDLVQGFYLSRPISYGELKNLLREML